MYARILKNRCGFNHQWNIRKRAIPTHNVPYILHDGDKILIGDTVLTFQFSHEIHTFPDDFAHDDASNPTWGSSAIDFSGKSVNGTIILIKDSNNTWKIDNLQNI